MDAVRAAPLPREERRRALLDATRPLLIEHGPGVSTRRIAEAAGIAEGTIFRVFPTKQDLLNETIVDALAPDATLSRLAALADAGDLTTLATGIVEALQQHAQETRTLLALVEHPLVTGGDAETCPVPRHGERHRGVVDAIERLLAAREAELSVSPRAAAGALYALGFGSTMAVTPSGTPPAPERVAHLILHGIAKDDAC